MSDISSSFFQTNDRGAARDPIIPRFYVKAVEMTFKSTQAGHPVFEDRDFVEMIIPGNRGSIVHEQVNDEHKHRWPMHYAAFKDGKEAPLTGTPVEEWPPCSASMVAMLKLMNVRTVEQLAELPDDALLRIGMGAREFRAKARAWLAQAKDGAELDRTTVALQMADDKIAALEKQVADLASKCEALMARQADDDAPEPKRRGRPPKSLDERLAEAIAQQ